MAKTRRSQEYKKLMAIAEAAIEVKGKGIRGEAQDHIITDEARDLFEAIEKDGEYTEAEKLAAQIEHDFNPAKLRALIANGGFKSAE